jgi:CheY-like chemotaxis protein
MKALVVDDSVVARAQIKKVLKEAIPDIEIDEAGSAMDGITKIRLSTYDIFTVDFNMPGGTGDTVIEQAKNKCPDAKIALLTANKQDSVKEKCSQWGVALLEKPHFQAALTSFVLE